MSPQKKWAAGYLAAFIVMIVMNYFVGTNVGNVADSNQPIIQPAGFAFSIWGLIYILVFIWIIKQFFQKTWEDSPAYKLKYWPIINFLLNSAWILVFTQQMILASVIVIFALLITLIIMHILITNQNYSWFDRFPYSVYFAWVTVASIVNVFQLTNDNNIDSIVGLDELTWTIIMLSAAGVIGLITALYFKDWLYPLVIIWPLYAIYVENSSEYSSLDITLLVISVLLAACSVITLLFKNKNKKPV